MTKLLTHNGFFGSQEISLEDNCLHGQLLYIDDVIVYEGDTPQELEQNFIQAVERYLSYCASTGKAANKPCSGTFNVRILPEQHRKALNLARQQSINLNEFVKAAIETAIVQAEKPQAQTATQNKDQQVTLILQVSEQQTHIIPNETPTWSEHNVTTTTATSPTKHH